MTILWICSSYIGAVFIRHETFTLGVTHFIYPAIIGVTEAFFWKPKEK